MTTPPTNPQELFTPFLPTTFEVPEEVGRDAFLSDNLCRFADIINDKTIGIYLQAAETFNGQKWWYKSTKINRNGYQAIAYIPAFPNTGTLTLTRNTDPQYPIPNVNPEFVVTDVWGSASRPCSAIGAGDGDYFSFFSEGNSKITFTMSDTKIVITATTDMTAYSGFIIVEYLRNGL